MDGIDTDSVDTEIAQVGYIACACIGESERIGEGVGFREASVFFVGCGGGGDGSGFLVGDTFDVESIGAGVEVFAPTGDRIDGASGGW